MIVEPEKGIKVFYSYAHQDESLRNELEKHLSMLKRQGVITTWYDRKVTAGTEWTYEIDTHLNTAQIILFLISPDFLASDYCYDVEVKQALKRHRAGEATVIPVFLRPVFWENTPFKDVQALPKDGRPIYHPNRYRRDKAFLDVALGILEVVEGINKKRLSKSSSENMLGYNRDTSVDSYESTSLDASIALVQAKRGDTLYERKDYNLALMSYSLAIILDHDYTLAYIGKGNTLYALKHFGDALKTYEQALLLDPLNAAVYNGKGNTFYAMKRYDESLEAYEQALLLEYNSDETYTHMISVLDTFNNYDDALSACEQLLYLKPAHRAAYQLKLLILHRLKRLNV